MNTIFDNKCPTIYSFVEYKKLMPLFHPKPSYVSVRNNQMCMSVHIQTHIHASIQINIFFFLFIKGLFPYWGWLRNKKKKNSSHCHFHSLATTHGQNPCQQTSKITSRFLCLQENKFREIQFTFDKGTSHHILLHLLLSCTQSCSLVI